MDIVEEKRDILKDVLNVIEELFNLYKKNLYINFKDYEEIYEKLVDILSGIDFHVQCPWKMEKRWVVKNNNTKELLKNLGNMKINILFELQEFCLIRRNDILSGMGSYIFTNLNSIIQCLCKNKIPVIDMRNCKTPFSKVKGISNGWEAFFEQPLGIGLDGIDINDSLPVCNIYSIDDAVLMDDFYYNKDLQKFWHKAYEKYMRFTPETKCYIEKEHDAFFKNIDIGKVCGVLCRGTDFNNLKPYGHPVQPGCGEVIEKTKEVMKNYGCEYIFLATEDKMICDRFREEFGERKLLVTKTYMAQYNDSRHIAQVQEDANIDFFQNSLDYISTLYQLSTLKYFISGNTSGAMSVYFMSSGFEYSYVWNKGRYGIDNNEVLDVLASTIF